MIKLQKSGSTVRVMRGRDDIRVTITRADGSRAGRLFPSPDPSLVIARVVSGLVEDGWQIV